MSSGCIITKRQLNFKFISRRDLTSHGTFIKESEHYEGT